MPHFVVECSKNVLTVHSEQEIIQTVFDMALASGLFDPKNIKSRMRSYDTFITAGDRSDFIHVFAYIMEGRNTAQKNNLSRDMVRKLKGMFPDVPVISMNVMDFEKATYNNRNTV